MTDTTELKPCPFCGKDNLQTKNTMGNFYNAVSCLSCGLSTAEQLEIIEKWNTRPIEDALQRRLDIAVKALTEISNSTNEAYLTGGREMKRIASQAIAAWNEMNKVEVNDDKPE